MLAPRRGSSLSLSVGALQVLGAALAQASFFVLQKPLLAKYGGFAVTCYSMWSATIFLLPLVGWLAADLPDASGKAITALVFLGIGPSAIGFVTWGYAQHLTSVAKLTNLLYLGPVITIAISWLVLGETPRLLAVLGGVITLVAVVVSRRKPAPVAVPAKSEPSRT